MLDMTDNQRWPKCCPKCGRQGACADSREGPGYVKRRYRCVTPNCGHRWTTAEFLVAEGATEAGAVRRFLESIARDSMRDRINSAIHSLRELL